MRYDGRELRPISQGTLLKQLNIFYLGEEKIKMSLNPENPGIEKCLVLLWMSPWVKPDQGGNILQVGWSSNSRKHLIKITVFYKWITLLERVSFLSEACRSDPCLAWDIVEDVSLALTFCERVMEFGGKAESVQGLGEGRKTSSKI